MLRVRAGGRVRPSLRLPDPHRRAPPEGAVGARGPPGQRAERRTFGGFCYFNSNAIAAHALSAEGRVAIPDKGYNVNLPQVEKLDGKGHRAALLRALEIIARFVRGLMRSALARPEFLRPRPAGGRK